MREIVRSNSRARFSDIPLESRSKWISESVTILVEIVYFYKRVARLVLNVVISRAYIISVSLRRLLAILFHFFKFRLSVISCWVYFSHFPKEYLPRVFFWGGWVVICRSWVIMFELQFHFIIYKSLSSRFLKSKFLLHRAYLLLNLRKISICILVQFLGSKSATSSHLSFFLNLDELVDFFV